MSGARPTATSICRCGGSCPNCQQAPSTSRLIQRRSVSPLNQGNIKAPPSVTATLASQGRPLDNQTRAFMEPRFGMRFSNVRIHDGANAAKSTDDIHAKAYTCGNHIVFARNQYKPNTDHGRKLLAHELTHVIQQSGGSRFIQRFPNPAPPPAPYTPGRPAHNHPAIGAWPLVQANARSICKAIRTTINLPGGGSVSVWNRPTTIKEKSECACAVLSPLSVLTAAKHIQMRNKPLAVAHLDHYISGGGADFVEHTNLDNLMKTDAGARGVVANAIASADRGNVFIRQGHYSDENFRLAFGGIDRVDYQVNRTASTVDVWFKDRYDFHPAGFGYTNLGTGDYAPPGRPTNCVHAAAVEAKSSGAADYWMFGHATLPLSLITGGSTGSSGSGSTGSSSGGSGSDGETDI
ncbi:eCIS core domain-containing protein [Grimontia marina]|nr:DUF4157 domain-containing protein [Grimontia marina]